MQKLLDKSVVSTIPYGTNFGGTKLQWIAANKHFGGQNIGGLAALHCKLG